ncbi:MAG: hypothetical protein JSR48_12415 [Verrucomicrobia bacterium]|nr:hypothetical protein [Verrucomicrobiota bacterium]
MSAPAQSLDPRARRQVVIITLVAAAIFLGFRYLPTGTNLSHMDFRATATNSIEFCDPLNPQFIPVVAVKSPVVMTLTAPAVTAAGQTLDCTVNLRTASGKPIAPEDLLVSHTRKLHLLIIDPWLDDYQHVHPEPGLHPGDWTFSFTPKREGVYRVFADFTPVATARGLYASTDLKVGRSGLPPAYQVVMRHEPSWKADRDGLHCELTPAVLPVQARRPVDLRLTITRPGGGRVPLEPVMGAFAHLVAFDEARSGFAHLHPLELDLTQPPDPVKPTLNFKVMIPQAGSYVIWAQLNVAGHEEFVPFWFDVEG